MNGNGNGVASDDAFLLAQFREFYREVIRLKRMLRSGTWETGATTEAGEGSQVGLRVWQRLTSVLEQQALTAGRSVGAYGAELYKEAQYVMAALGDEIFIHLEWEGREAWRSNLIESRLFGTHAAGDVLFQRLEALLARRDPVWAEVAKVYLMALSLGFRGKYQGVDDGGQIDVYRRQLFTFIFQRKPELQTSARPLFQDAYQHTLVEGSGKRLPSAKPWVAVLCVLVAVFLVSSHALFNRVTAPLAKVANEFLSVR